MSKTCTHPHLVVFVNHGYDVVATSRYFGECGNLYNRPIQQPILAYSSSGGLFAAAAFKIIFFFKQKTAYEMFYARAMNDILFDPLVRPNATGQHLIDVLETYAGRRTN